LLQSRNGPNRAVAITCLHSMVLRHANERCTAHFIVEATR